MPEWTVFVPCALWSINAERSMHWRERNDRVGQVRMLAKHAAREAKVPHLDRVRIEATPQQARGTLADPGNHYPVVKACIDGLVDAKVIDNDTKVYVAEIQELPPERVPASKVGMILRVMATE